MNENKILIPILSKKEMEKNFLETATKNAKEIVLLLVIDKNEFSGRFGFAASEIMQGAELMEAIKKNLEGQGKKVSDIQEWGDTATKIEHIALLQKTGKVFLLEQDNDYFRSLARQLKKSLEGKIETIKLSEEKPQAKA